MKIISLNSSDTFGGAARAALRLQHGLRGQGVDARMLVQRKFSDHPFVIGPADALQRGMGLARNVLDQLPLKLYRGRGTGPFSPSLVPSCSVARLNRLNPDLVHLHWVCEGMTSIWSLSGIKAPVLWTLHDSWPFTGGCHVPHHCTAFEENCGACPQLGSSCGHDLSRAVWTLKRNMLRRLRPVIISPSRWLAGRAAQSSLLGDLRIEVIPNGIDTGLFRPIEKAAAKRLLGLDQDKKVLLFSAIDGGRHHHKGFHLLVSAREACAKDPQFRDSHLLLVVGSAAPDDAPELPIPVHYAGKLQDDTSISLMYNAADLYLSPALLENFSTTVLESLSCGTPCVAFQAGGMADLVQHGRSGYLATAYDTEEFARGIIWCLEDRERLAQLSAQARSTVCEQFDVELTARRHIKLYEDVWSPSRS
jgi:glycosyltransferase involved in cell wall biosynthesis